MLRAPFDLSQKPSVLSPFRKVRAVRGIKFISRGIEINIGVSYVLLQLALHASVEGVIAAWL